MSTGVWDYYISPHATVEGPVTFGTGCVVLAYARITAPRADVPVRFGNYCLVEEHVDISYSSDVTTAAESLLEGVTIGSHTHFRSHSWVRDVAGIGQGCVLQPFASVAGTRAGRPSEIGEFCLFAPHVQVDMSALDNNSSGGGGISPRPCVIPPRSTVLPTVAAQDHHPNQQPSRAFAVIPRYGSRSAVELPSMAQSLLLQLSTDGTGALAEPTAAVATAAAVGADLLGTDNTNNSHAESEQREEFFEGGEGGNEDDNEQDDEEGAADMDGKESSLSSIGSDSRLGASRSPNSLIAHSARPDDIITPQRRRFTTASAAAAASRGDGGSGPAVTPAAVEAMLGTLPQQVERVSLLHVTKLCRYYLTLYAIV